MKSIGRSWALGINVAVVMVLVNLTIAEAGNFALSFSGSTTPPQIGVAPLVTTATDDLWMDVWLKWAGPATIGTITGVQTPVYNGNSFCSGWGITVVDATGEVAILAGGVGFGYGNVFLTPGQWQHVRASRLGGVFQLRVDGVVNPLSSNPSPNAIGQNPACTPGEATIIGSGSAPVFAPPFSSTDPYDGEIDKVRINVIGATPQDGLTLWHLDEGSGTTATDIHGTVMTLIGNPAWVSGASKP